MGRLLFLAVFLVLLGAFVSRALAFLRRISALGGAQSSGFSGELSREAAAALPAVQALVRTFIGASRQELPKRLDELAALLGAVDGAVRQQGVVLPPKELRDLLARALAAQLPLPDYQIRTLLDFVP